MIFKVGMPQSSFLALIPIQSLYLVSADTESGMFMFIIRQSAGFTCLFGHSFNKKRLTDGKLQKIGRLHWHTLFCQTKVSRAEYETNDNRLVSILQKTCLFDGITSCGLALNHRSELVCSVNKLMAHQFIKVTRLHVYSAGDGVLQVLPAEKVSMSEGTTLHIGPNFTWRDDAVPEVDVCYVPYEGLSWVKASTITVLILTQNYTGSTGERGFVPQNFPTTLLSVDPQCRPAIGGAPRPANRVPFTQVIWQPLDLKRRPLDVRPVHADGGLVEQEGVGLSWDCQGEQSLTSGQ